MRKSREIPSNTTVRPSSASQVRRAVRRYPFNPTGVNPSILRLYDMVYDALKVITLGLSAEESDFFAEYGNLDKIYGLFGACGLQIGDARPDEETFAGNPIGAWTELTALLVGTLYTLPAHGGVVLETLKGASDANVMSLTVHTEHIDRKSHYLGVVVHENGEKLVFVDFECRLGV